MLVKLLGTVLPNFAAKRKQSAGLHIVASVVGEREPVPDAQLLGVGAARLAAAIALLALDEGEQGHEVGQGLPASRLGDADAPRLAVGIVEKLARAVDTLGLHLVPSSKKPTVEGKQWRVWVQAAQLPESEGLAVANWIEDVIGEEAAESFFKAVPSVSTSAGFMTKVNSWAKGPS